jgi:hypothetical protein
LAGSARFADLSEQEVLALAISNEDEDNRIYRCFADALRASYPDTAQMYDKMAEEEISHQLGDIRRDPPRFVHIYRDVPLENCCSLSTASDSASFCRSFAART